MDKPTFKPSILSRHWRPPADPNGPPNEICHSYVTDGRISFLTDSTHDLRGRVVELPPLPS